MQKIRGGYPVCGEFRIERYSIRDRHWSPGLDRPEEVFGHEFRHPDASMRCRITGKISGVHADSANDSHEIRHGCAFELRAWRLLVLLDVDVRDNHIALSIDEIAVFTRDVILVFLDDGIATRWRIES